MKRFTILLSAVLLCASLAVPAFAVEVAPVVNEADVVTRAEETEWMYRVVDGQWQRRLWSITYGKWLTEWENFYG